MEHQHVTALKEAGMKATPKRLAILEALNGLSCYASPEELWKQLRARFDRLGLPTVYRNLEELAESGVITKVIHPNRQLYYYFCHNRDHHHHFVCLSCRKVEDVPSCGIEAMAEVVQQQSGGRVLSHILQLNGVCGSCLRSGAPQ
ncbi:Fur family transcriptional regulator [Geomesophilobacter sediminis]|uniref:Transcriptional repressor n=1 Tax=Geomesophilobacter sediminis TaxID=2798584 RepID=A0A8J7IQ78_9BACT|nr:transcriptional repressor [Geomesophilobacter sediminis]MBJ6724729.1 transcriptional repressor [Geomesophilobacter sediminis]